MDQNSLTTDEAKKADIDELLKKLSANQKGLSSSEAEKRRQQYGPNEIQEKKANPLKKFLGYFWGPIPWMIEAAVVMSAVIQRWPDFGIILTLLMVNAIVGFWQEHKAGNAIELLKQRLAINARDTTATSTCTFPTTIATGIWLIAKRFIQARHTG
jgi:H+-transporting ATPase